VKVQDPEKLNLLYERLRDVCLVEKEVWKEIYLPRDEPDKKIRITSLQDRYEVVIDSPEVEAALEANIPLGSKALAAAIAQYKEHISFHRA
jgi:hypothetical protein